MKWFMNFSPDLSITRVAIAMIKPVKELIITG
jgi:hypothetical protein